MWHTGIPPRPSPCLLIARRKRIGRYRLLRHEERGGIRNRGVEEVDGSQKDFDFMVTIDQGGSPS